MLKNTKKYDSKIHINRRRKPFLTKDIFQAILTDKHIRILCPSSSRSMYYNYKWYSSVLLQAVSSEKYISVVYIVVGVFGKQ